MRALLSSWTASIALCVYAKCERQRRSPCVMSRSVSSSDWCAFVPSMGSIVIQASVSMMTSARAPPVTSSTLLCSPCNAWSTPSAPQDMSTFCGVIMCSVFPKRCLSFARAVSMSSVCFLVSASSPVISDRIGTLAIEAIMRTTKAFGSISVVT